MSSLKRRNVNFASITNLLKRVFVRLEADNDRPAEKPSVSTAVAQNISVMDDEERMKIDAIMARVAEKSQISQSKFKMKEQYFQRVLYDYVALNQGLQLSKLFDDFEEKPLYVSKMLKGLLQRGKIKNEPDGNDYRLYVEDSSLENNLILKKLNKRNYYSKLINMMAKNRCQYSFFYDTLTILIEKREPIKIKIRNWRKL